MDKTFPAADFGAEWAMSTGTSEEMSGDIPLSYEVADDRTMYDKVFSRAINRAKELRTGKKVAVLCLSHEQFDIYQQAGNYKKNFLPIASRSLIDSVEHAGKRFIFSMPEYVAGLQFDTVYLIEANENDVAETGAGLAARRRFVSAVYLGASRAQRVLEIFSNMTRGGRISELTRTLKADALVNGGIIT